MLQQLTIVDFRCLPAIDIAPSPRVNLISGPNGSGKTSLLEAIYTLSRGRSFRTSQMGRLIRDGNKAFLVTAEVSGDPIKKLGVRGPTTGGLEARINGAPAPGISALSEALPVEIIDPQAHKLIEEGPEGRRRFIDWGTFQTDPGFLTTWRRYRRALRQRSAALVTGAALDAWDSEVAEAGEQVAEARAHYVETLKPGITETCAALLDSPVAVSHRSGWPDDETLIDALRRSREQDQRLKRTHVGPHRADLVVDISDRRARQRVSRGQQKLLAAGLVLAQAKLLATNRPGDVVLLIDDPVAELDQANLERLLVLLESFDAQLFITALDPDKISLAAEPLHIKL